LQAFKEAGGLQVLVGLITDKSTSEDENRKDKDGKAKKEKSSKGDGGRKSRVTDEGGQIIGFLLGACSFCVEIREFYWSIERRKNTIRVTFFVK
jgi:hypothetical protein